MSFPSPFEVARLTGNNLNAAFAKKRDESSIEKILKPILDTQDPELIQNSIGQIISKVSPERQGPALQYLQYVAGNIENKQKLAREQAALDRQRKAALQAGVSPDLPANLQAEQLKANAKNQRIAAANSPFMMGNQGVTQPQESLQFPGISAPPQAQPPQNVDPFAGFTDAQLIQRAGHPDREVSEPAKEALKQRQEDKKITSQRDTELFKSDLGRANQLLEKANQISEQIPQKDTALKLMDDALANKDLSFFTGDNLAEITGIERFRSKEGAIFKLAGKEYFLGNIGRAGARPNQWIEQQISDMMSKIGRSNAANLSVNRALRNELDLDRERVRATNEIADQLRKEGQTSMGDLGARLNEHMQKYATEKQNELFNDLRAIKAIDDKKAQRYHKVKKGTPISPVMAQSLLLQFNNDPDKAAEEATKLGYQF